MSVSAPIALVDYESTGTATSHAKAVAADAAVGALVVVAADVSNVTNAMTLTDSKGNTWTALLASPARTGGATGNTGSVQLWYSVLTTALVNSVDTLTLATTPTNVRANMIAFTLTGVNTSTPIRVAAAANNEGGTAGTAWTAPGVTPTAGDLVLAVGLIGGASGAFSAFPAAFTDYLKVADTRALDVLYRQATSSLAVNPAGTLSASNPWIGVSVVFQTASTFNTAPTANAGPDQANIPSSSTVTLNGSGSSDPDAGDTITYAWTQTAGTTVSLSSATAASPTFTSPAGFAGGSLTFSLVVTDNHGSASSPDTVTITGVPLAGSVLSTQGTVTTSSNAPSITLPTGITNGSVAYILISIVAGAVQTIASGFAGWTNVGAQDATSSRAILLRKAVNASDSGTTVSGTLSGVVQWDTACAVVHGAQDNLVASQQASLQTSQTVPAITPVAANCTDLVIASTASAANTSAFTGTPSGGFTEDQDGSGASATLNNAGVYIQHRDLTGQAGVSQTATSFTTSVNARSNVWRITVGASSNSAPNANAGVDQSGVEPFSTVTLNGTGSTDPDVGDTLTYAWTQTAGTAVTLSSSTAASPTFTAPATPTGGTLTFSLVVTDNHASASSPDTVDIAVVPHTLFRMDAGGPTPIQPIKL